ncbi:MAG: PmoA family protein [Acidobacteriota bacterium]
MKRLAMVIALIVLSSSGAVAQGRVSFKEGSQKIDIEIDAQPYATFHYEDNWLKPFLHTVRAASGTIVTRNYPLEKIPGESNDHFWHHGIWYGHGDINGIDFWREFTGDPVEDAKFRLPIGRFVIKGKPRFKTSGGTGTLSADFDLVKPDKTSLGTIRQVFTFRRSGSDNLIDAEITISADRGVALKMGDTEEGSLGLRFADDFKEDRGAILTNSDGLKGSANIWGKRARWVDYSTAIRGEKVGLSIFDHPKNPKHPTFWHARGYGLCGVNPFGEHDFYNDKTRDGSLTIPTGKKLSFRYRVVIHAGSGEVPNIEKAFDLFSRGR